MKQIYYSIISLLSIFVTTGTIRANSELPPLAIQLEVTEKSTAFNVHSNKPYFIDFGDGNPREYPANGDKAFPSEVLSDFGMVTGRIVKIYGESITGFRHVMKALKSVDVTRCTSLTYLQLSGAKLPSLDISNNTKLHFLDLQYNQLTSIDLSAQIELEELMLGGNQLTEVRLPSARNLRYLSIFYNKLTNRAFADIVESLNDRMGQDPGKCFVIDLSNGNEENVIYKSTVEKLKAKNWRSLDWNGGFGYETEYPYEGEQSVEVVPAGTPMISVSLTAPSVEIVINSSEKTWVNWGDEEYVEYPAGDLVLKGVAPKLLLKIYTGGLNSIKAGEQPISGVDLSQAENLNEIMIFRSPMAQIDLSPCKNLETVSVQNNKLSSIDISMLPKLKHLDVHGNTNISHIDVSANKELDFISCGECSLSEVNVKSNPNLTVLECTSNGLEDLDVSSLPELTVLYIWNNKFKDETCRKIATDLPVHKKGLPGFLHFVDETYETEQNFPSETAVKIATEKNWLVYDQNGGEPREFYGYYTSAQDISPANYSYYAEDGSLSIRGLSAGELGRLYSLDGQKITTAVTNAEGVCLMQVVTKSGLYIFVVGDKAYRILL